MKKYDFLFFSFFKKTTRWVSLFTALIFLLSVCAPAWAREGNHGSATALKSFGSGALVGAITSIACIINPVGGAVGSAAGDITGLVMYYTSYSDYGKTWLKIGKMEISKGQICSMIAGIAATAGANLLAGAIEGAAEEGVGSAIESTAENGVASTATTAATSAATSAAPGLLSSVVSAAIQLPVNIIKAIIQFVKDLIEEGLKTALKNLLKNLVDVFVDFAVTIAKGFWQTCKDIWRFVTDPVGFIKDTFKNFFSRKTSVTANPYYRYGASGEFDKALVHLGGDLGVGMIKLVVSEYVKQNLKEGITIRGKKIIGPMDETIAGMIGNMVSNYVGASMNVMVMKSLGEICGWDIDNQGGFLSRGEVDPNKAVTINGTTNDDVTISDVYNATQGKIDPSKQYDFYDDKGNKITATGQQLIDANPELASQLQTYSKGMDLYQEMAKSGANNAAMGDTNGESSKTISEGELGNYGLKLGTGDKLVSDKAVDGKLVVKMDNGESMTIDLNKSSAESNGQFKLAITNRQLGVTAQELSNSGVTGNQTGTFKVRLNDKSVVDVTINNENAGTIKAAVDKYNSAMNGYAQVFGQYGVLAMADPNRSIGVVVTGKDGQTRNLTIGELSSQQELVADVMKNQGVSRTGYKLTLKNGEEVRISAESLTNQVTGELRNYHVMLNSSGYSQLFNMTGGLMYNINGKDMNTQGILRSGFEAVRNMGLAPIISTATRIALLKVMDYHTHYSNDKGRIYENMWKMALANAGANVVTDAFNNLDSVQEAIYGLESGQNPFATKGSNSFGLHIAARALEEGGGALSQIAWGAYLKKNNLSSDAMNEMAHLLGTSLVAGSIDALFRQDRGLVETENGRTTLKGSQTDPMLDSRLSLDNLGDSSVRFTKGVLGDFKNQIIEVALDSVLIPFPLRSPGTGPNAFMNQWAVQDKFTQQISSIAQGASPIDADLMRISSNLSYRADTNFAESFSSAISNSFLPLDLRSYTSFGSKGITDYRVNRSLIERIDLEKNPDLKAALKNYVKKLKDDAVLDRQEGRINEAINNEVKALELEQSIEQGVFSSTRSTYRPSIAGVAQDQFTYGNAIISSGALGGVNKAINKETGGSLYTLTLDEAKVRTPFIYDAINPDGTSKEDSEARFNTLIGQLSEDGGVKLYSPNTMLLDYTTVDQFGRLQNTYYYGGEYDGSNWQATKLDKYTQHFYGPFGHQLSVTKDSTQIRPVKVEQIPIYKDAWTETISPKTEDVIESGITFNLPGNDRKELREKSKKLLEALKLSGDEQKIALSELGVITMNADEIKAKIESFLKENPDAVKEMTQLFRRSWHKLGYNTTKSVTARGLQSAPWNMVVMMMMMEGKNGEKAWSDLSDDEKVNLYINSTNFSRYLSDAAYVSNGAVPVGSAKRDADGQLASTNVNNPDQSGNDQYKELPQTIFLPGYFNKIPGKPAETKDHDPEVIGHKDLPARQVSANYSYDLSLYSTGAGSSPYSGPKYQVGAYEVNSNLAMEAGGVKKAQGLSVAEYHRFTGRSSSGISAFSDQITTPSWSVDTEFGMDSAFKTSQAKQYYYSADKIGAEIGDKVNKDKAKGNEASVKALESVELHGIKDVTGKELTFVTGDMEDPNYYGAFYKQYNESVNQPVAEDNQARQEAIEDTLKVLQDHSIGSDAVLLRSDFKDKKVTHNSVKDNEQFKQKTGISVAPSSFRLPPGYFDIDDEDLLAFNDVGDNGNGSISDAVNPMAESYSGIRSVNLALGALAGKATAKLVGKVNEKTTELFIKNIDEDLVDPKKEAKVLELFKSGHSRDVVKLTDQLYVVATDKDSSSTVKSKAFEILSSSYKDISSSGSPDEQAAWFSSMGKLAARGAFAEKAADSIIDKISSASEVPVGIKIDALGLIRSSLAVSKDQKALAQDKLINMADVVFREGTPEDAERLYNNFTKSVPYWTPGSETDFDSHSITSNQAIAMYNALEKNIGIIRNKLSSEKHDFDKELQSVKVYANARELGIKHVGRFSGQWHSTGGGTQTYDVDLDLLQYVTEERLKGAQKGDAPLIVWLATTYDPTNANSKNGELGKNLKSLRDAGFRVMYYEVNDKDGIAQSLKDACGNRGKVNPADMIIWSFHGNQYSMQLGADTELNVRDESYLKEQHVGDYLKSGGRIMLESCSTGQGGKTKDNMVNFFRRVFPQAQKNGVTGPKTPSYFLEMKIDKAPNGRPVIKDIGTDVDDYSTYKIQQNLNQGLSEPDILPNRSIIEAPLT